MLQAVVGMERLSSLNLAHDKNSKTKKTNKKLFSPKKNRNLYKNHLKQIERSGSAKITHDQKI